MKTTKRLLSLLLCLCMLVPLGIYGVSADNSAPKASENVALGKPVDVTSGSGAESITDGNTGTYWDSTSGRTTKDSTVVIDLQAWYKLDDVTVITYHDGSRYYHFTVAVSANGVNYTEIGVKDNNDKSTAEGVTFPGTADSVRYIKVNMTKNSSNPEYHICEIMANGTLDADYKEPEITEDPDDPNNIAVGKPTRANYNSATANRVTDASIKTAWSGNMYPQYVDVDLMANYDISEIIVYMPTSDSYTYTLYGSLDGVRFDRIADSNEKKPGTAEGDTYSFETPLNYRVLRVNVTSAARGGKASVSEIRVHGKKNNTAVTPTRDKLEFSTYDEWLLKNHGVDTAKLKDANGNYDIEDTYTAQDTIAALKGLVSRVLGDRYVNWFDFEVVEADKDFFEISGGGNAKVKIKGNTGVAIASGLNYYLKYYCYVNVSQQTKQVKMPATAPKLDKAIHKDTDCEVRYAYNYCTLSYTMQFYGFDEWQKELDYLMLQGVNVILDTTGSEALWVSYLQKYGYTAQEAIDFVCGYAFKAWWLMGNLENYGGSVGDQWMYDTLEMARVNQRYMTVMGCMPCLNIFAGTLPTNFAKQADEVLTEMGYANVKDYMTGTGGWSGFTRPYSLNTTFPGFEQMTVDFYNVQNDLYGQITDYYAGDFLHEISSGFNLDPAFDKANMSRTVLDLLIKENDESCWIMQSWWENPLPEVVEGFGDDREDHVLMLDLACANASRWTNTKDYGGLEFGGSGWVFCMLDNYGGRTGMHGAFNHIMTGLMKAYSEAKHFKGIGITPEGTEENPASYDFYWELIWVGPDDVPANTTTKNFINSYVDNWVSEYAKRRYGTESEKIQQAWEILADTVYGMKTVDGTSVNGIITCEPKIFESGNNGAVAFGAGQNGGYYRVPYKEHQLEEVLKLMIAEFENFKDEETYIYDLCDIMCQILTNSSTVYLSKMAEGINQKNYETFHGYKNKFLRCIQLIDEVASYVDDTMLGNWVGRIDDWVADERTGEYADYDIDTMKHNAIILPTVWASNATLVGYANREYAGLMEDYYYKMWKDFLDDTDAMVARGSYRSAERDTNQYFQYAWDMIVDRGASYSREVRNPDGDTAKGHRSLMDIYKEIAFKLFVDSKIVANNLQVATGYKYTIEKKQLKGIEYGVTAKALSKALVGQSGGSVVVYGTDGNKLDDNAYVYNQCRAVLYDAFGSEEDSVLVTSVKGKAGVTLVESKMTLKAGETGEIAYGFMGLYEGEKAEISFISNNEAVATVDADGKITALAEGDAIITVKAGDYTDTLKLTVEKGEEKPIEPGSDEGAADDGAKDGGSNTVMIIVIVAAVVVLLGAGVTVLVLKKKKK